MNIAATIISSIALIVAIITLAIVSWQTRLLRKQIFGEVYDQAQIKDLEFYLPPKQKYTVEGFDQKEDAEIPLGQSISIPVGCERELHIRWRMAESQTLRSFVIGFLEEHEGQRFGFKSKPEIVDRIKAFVKKDYNWLPHEEYIDWHGSYHCEYGHARRLPKDECFVSALKVKGKQKGKYVLNVEIAVTEAPHPFKGNLEVQCQ